MSEWEWMRVSGIGWEWVGVGGSGWEWVGVGGSGLKVTKSEREWVEDD